jgi:putative transposase
VVLKDADVPIAPSTYYASKSRPPSKRAITDAETTGEIERVHRENYGVYGIRKVWAQLGREGGVGGRPIARCTVARLMKAAGLRGVSRVKTPRTTIRAAGPDRRPDLVDRAFTAPAPDRLWVADITYVKTHCGWVYASFVLDVFSRRIVGWQLSRNLYTDLALDALNMGVWTRQRGGADLSQLIHHSDRGVQYVAIRYTERLAEVDAVASVGSVGDSYDNAMAEAFNSLFKAELVRNKGPWRGIDDLEIAVAEYIDWYNHRRLHGELGLIPPVEREALHHDTQLARQPAEA